jgi:hypothetical protein
MQAREPPSSPTSIRAQTQPEPRGLSSYLSIFQLQLADWISLGNGLSGVSSVLLVLQYLDTQNVRFLWAAIGLLPLAAIFDALDGAVARWLRKVSLLGQELDSLSDVISFGVAPAVLAFGTCWLSHAAPAAPPSPPNLLSTRNPIGIVDLYTISRSQSSNIVPLHSPFFLFPMSKVLECGADGTPLRFCGSSPVE